MPYTLSALIRGAGARLTYIYTSLVEICLLWHMFLYCDVVQLYLTLEHMTVRRNKAVWPEKIRIRLLVHSVLQNSLIFPVVKAWKTRVDSTVVSAV